MEKFGDRVLHHVAVRVEDIEQAILKLKARGIVFAGEIVGARGGPLREQIFYRSGRWSMASPSRCWNWLSVIRAIRGFFLPSGQPDAIHGALIPRLESSRVAIVLRNATFWGRGEPRPNPSMCVQCPATRTALIGSFDCGYWEVIDMMRFALPVRAITILLCLHCVEGGWPCSGLALRSCASWHCDH